MCVTMSVLIDHLNNKHLCEKSFRCQKCTVAFNSYSQLSYHMVSHKDRRIIDETDDETFSCLYCSKIYPSDRVLKIHMSIHTGENPWLQNKKIRLEK